MRPLTVAVTGLNASDNPGPGVGVARALRHSPSFRGQVIGLAYDAMEPGLYTRDLFDEVFLIPYPSQGIGPLRERLAYIRARTGMDVVIPTLDAELPSFVALADELRADGVGTFLPTAEQLDLRSKAKLNALGDKGLPVPPSRVLTDVAQLYTVHEHLQWPVVVKGPFYGAKVAHTLDEAVAGFHKMVAEWGYPVIVQQFVAGQELCVLAVGDGDGGLVGAVQMRKTVITDKGKGWAGVAIRDPGLDALAEVFMKATKWRGPCELEVIRDAQRRLPRAGGEPALPRVVLPLGGRGDEPPAGRGRARGGSPRGAHARVPRGHDVRAHRPRPAHRRRRALTDQHRGRAHGRTRPPRDPARPAGGGVVSRPLYTRPVIARHLMGMMNKFSRVQSMQAQTHIDGVSVEELVQTYGSPLFVFSERTMVQRYRALRDAFARRFERVRLAWSYKTNYLDAVCKVFHREGAWAEVVSEFEWEKARHLGVPGSQIHLNGPLKTEAVLRRVLPEGTLVHVDNFDELAILEKVAADLGIRPKVAVRVNMGVESIPAWSRFGFNLENGQAMTAAVRIATGRHLELAGLHCHLGTFILDPSAYREQAGKLAAMANELLRAHGVVLSFLDVGGGLSLAREAQGAVPPG